MFNATFFSNKNNERFFVRMVDYKKRTVLPVTLVFYLKNILS